MSLVRVAVLALLTVACADRPNIVLIIADDLGWNDVGFHGLNNIGTPNIDALAASGVILQHQYVMPICTPSRSALMTGKHPVHLGMQHGVLYGMNRRGLPLSEKLLPQYLKDLGYKTHLVGKWHLGSFKKEYLPLYRGFDSHLGYWTGKIDMYDHTNAEQNVWGFDFWRGFDPAYDLFGHYATDVYTTEAVRIINSHNKSQPLFLTVAHTAVHSGNPAEPIRAPDAGIAKLDHIPDYQRRKFGAVLTKLDESVGKVVEALSKRDLLNNSVILFTTDNGGVPAGFNDNAGSNYPLRGTKNTLWEGGVRGSAALWSPLLAARPRVASQRVHFVDWLPTLLSAAGGDPSQLRDGDGVDQWQALSEDRPSPRNETLLNIDDVDGFAAILSGDWKLMQGTNYNGKWDDWYGPDGRQGAYNMAAVYDSLAGKAIAELNMMPEEKVYAENRESATVRCEGGPTAECKPLDAPCLFNIQEDPCERNNLADKEPEILSSLMEALSRWRQSAVAPNLSKVDLCGDPKYWGHLYFNFGDFDHNETDCRIT